MKIKNIGIRFKMNLYILSVVIIVFVLSFVYVIYSYRTTSVKMAEDLAISKANDVANRTEIYLTKSLQIARTISDAFISMKKENEGNPKAFSLILKQLLNKSNHILSAWVICEPHIYNSEEYIQNYSKYYDESGRLSITWFDVNGEILLGDPEVDLNADFYTIPKKTKKEALLNPYMFKYTSDSKEFLVTSVSVPMIENGEIIGVVGLDIDLERLQEINSKTKLYETGYSAIIANDYTISAHPDKSNVGTSLLNILNISESGDIAKSIKSGESLLYEFHSEYLKADVLSAFVPINIGESSMPWSLEVIIVKDEMYKDVIKAIVSIVIFAILALLIIGAVVYFIARSILNPVLQGVSFAKKIAYGDLTDSLEVTRNDELGELLTSLNHMTKKLREVIEHVAISSKSILEGSNQISSTSQQMSQGANEQASSTEEISSTMEEMVSNIQQNTDNAKTTETISKEAQKGALDAGSKAKQSTEAQNIISEKIGIINDIAFQTNILALNAAVEAARAGEHGKGFAVVAAEVRKLAEQSKIAAEEITNLTQNTKELADKAGQSLSGVIPQIEKTANLVQEIALASIKQNSGAEQVNNSIQQLNQVAQQNAASSEELASTAEEMSAQAQQLKEAISYFKLN